MDTKKDKKKYNNRLDTTKKVRLYAINLMRTYEKTLNNKIDCEASKTLIAWLKLINECIRNDNDDRISELEKILEKVLIENEKN